MQFGSSNTAVFFKMRVAGVLHIFQFETKQVLLISLLMFKNATPIYRTFPLDWIDIFVTFCHSHFIIFLGRRNLCSSSDTHK
jgi:Gpi18-like mannosyltransferase